MKYWTILLLCGSVPISFSVAVVIALIAAIIHYAHLNVPYVHSGFTLLLVGFLVLAAGNVLRGL